MSAPPNGRLRAVAEDGKLVGMPMKFIALPSVHAPAMRATGLADLFQRVGAAAQARGYTAISGFSTLDAMFREIKNKLEANNFDCMEVLEINAHGSPQTCDGVTLHNAAAFGTQLRSVSLCDNVHVYLSGCNTAVRSSFNESLAQLVSRHTPTEAADMTRVYVHGSVGYLAGTFMQDNGVSTRNCWSRGHYYVTYPDIFVNGVREKGSSEGRGAACFRAFREGNPA